MDLEVVKTTPIIEPMAQLNIGANFTLIAPPRRQDARPLDARDPLTGAKKWEVEFPEPPLASLLSTGGNLLFVPDARGCAARLRRDTGKELWTHNNGPGHNGGIITYCARASSTSRWRPVGGLVCDDYPTLFGEPCKSMPKDAGVLVVFSLKQ